MTRSNVDAIYAEYPFLSKFIPRAKVSSAYVNRWSEEFLNSTPDSYPDSGTEKLYLVDKNDQVVSRVGTWWQLFLSCVFVSGLETVGQTLARLEDAQVRRIKYAVGVWGDQVTLSKLPNGYDNAADWLRDHVEKSHAELLHSVS